MPLLHVQARAPAPKHAFMCVCVYKRDLAAADFDFCCHATASCIGYLAFQQIILMLMLLHKQRLFRAILLMLLPVLLLLLLLLLLILLLMLAGFISVICALDCCSRITLSALVVFVCVLLVCALR